MDIKNLFADDQAVSPVIGVILMVAITVILAAVIGTFVLGLGDQVSSNAPQASFTFDLDSDQDPSEATDLSNGLADNTDDAEDGNLTVTHDGGDSIAGPQLTFTDGSESFSGERKTLYDGNDVSAGSSVNFAMDDDDTIRVVWNAQSGDSTATLGKFTGPNA